MMRLVWAATLAAGVGVLSGCNALVNEATFAARRDAMIGNPVMVQKELDECVTKSRQAPKMVETMALIANVPRDRAAEVVCARTLKAVREGRLTYQQYREGSRGNVSPEIVRIIQGR